MQKLKTLEEVSNERNIPQKTLRRWATQGMKSIKAGSIRFTDEWVDEYIENMANERANVPNKGTVKEIKVEELEILCKIFACKIADLIEV